MGKPAATARRSLKSLSHSFTLDFVAGFQHRHEAERFLAELHERFARFGLQLHADKTRIVEFVRYTEHNRRNRGAGKPETFSFLGFTHSCGKTRKGHFTVLRQTMRQRWQAKLRALKAELRRRMHDKERTCARFCWAISVITGCP
jgi:RNA-directed DNA polymerase